MGIESLSMVWINYGEKWLPKVYEEWSFPVKSSNWYRKGADKAYQFTNVDTDSDMESTEVSIPSWEQLRQIRVDRFNTLFSNNSDALLPTISPSYSSITMSSSSSSLNVNINAPNTPSTVASQDIVSYSMSTTSMNDTLISTVESPSVRLRPLRFRHSIKSPSLAMNSNSFKPIERDTPITNTEQNISILWGIALTNLINQLTMKFQ